MMFILLFWGDLMSYFGKVTLFATAVDLNTVPYRQVTAKEKRRSDIAVEI